jgi:hypothetical protein
MSLPDQYIVFLGRTLSGHYHDYSMLKHEFPPEFDWFEDIHVGVDLGYQVFNRITQVIRLTFRRKSLAKAKRTPTLS